ncbi:hypothetical protein [Pyxidicoccus xibeiensis]|uniref:hypothetical protein n=1 Tax=Pyxidicoccus xibeiensis TaxID=2906759 RepID=UPI0020A6FF07|nr:hypothetical protein [Pyxidicoccus xibeiensis]MCP3142872.1 hypothetical protein [Pyxidicoccus xibeiensis]
MAGNKGKGPNDEHPRGENFQPRNRGQMEDAQDRGAAEVARRLASERDANRGPHSDTTWEERVERGEEWTTEKVPEREARGDEEPNSEVSRRGLVNPPPEE